MSYYFHIIKDFSQVTISISPNYPGEIKMDYINAMVLFFFFLRHKRLTV